MTEKGDSVATSLHSIASNATSRSRSLQISLRSRDCCPLGVCLGTGRLQRDPQCGDVFLEFAAFLERIALRKPKRSKCRLDNWRVLIVPSMSSSSWVHSTRSYQEKPRIASMKWVAQPQGNNWPALQRKTQQKPHRQEILHSEHPAEQNCVLLHLGLQFSGNEVCMP